jgi:HEAT repeat protein
MAKKRDRTLEQLDGLKALEGEPLEGETLARVEAALDSDSNLVAAAAVRLVAGAGDPRWSGRLEEVFLRFMQSPATTDPGCVAKQAVVEALQQMETENATVFTAGIRHVQMEPVRGGSTDTAADLRGLCLAGLVSLGHRDALFHGSRLLADREPETRYLAVQALGHTGVEAAELLLRMKVYGGDRDPRVTGACFTALVRLNPQRSLPFVAEFLTHGYAEVAEAAALALGESRRAEAFTFLRDAWDRNLTIREQLILPMALIRSEEAFDFLESLIAAENPRYATSAIEALGIYHADQNIYTRVAQTIAANPAPEKNRAFERYFEDA